MIKGENAASIKPIVKKECCIPLKSVFFMKCLLKILLSTYRQKQAGILNMEIDIDKRNRWDVVRCATNGMNVDPNAGSK